MNTFKKIVAFLSVAIFCSCNPVDSNNTGVAKKDSLVIDTTVISNTINPASPFQGFLNTQSFRKDEIEDYSIADFIFQDFSLSINHLIVYEDDQQTIQSEKDTLTIYAEPGYDGDIPNIKVTVNHLTNFTIEQRYETSVTINNEGPHCDLKDWKHFYSDWKQLKSNGNNQFAFNSYTEKEWTAFPEVSIDELRKKVKEHCGEEYAKLVTNVELPTESPSNVSISRYFLRIKGQHNDTGTTITKLIVIEFPMVC